MILVDTSAWYALTVPTDENHARAVAFVQQNQAPLFTTDYVVDELLTLLRMRGHAARAQAWIDDVLSAPTFRLERVTAGDFAMALAVFQKYADKQWSFTDCTSFVVMQRMSIGTAFAFDNHFSQFSRMVVVP